MLPKNTKPYQPTPSNTLTYSYSDCSFNIATFRELFFTLCLHWWYMPRYAVSSALSHVMKAPIGIRRLQGRCDPLATVS